MPDLPILAEIVIAEKNPLIGQAPGTALQDCRSLKL